MVEMVLLTIRLGQVLNIFFVTTQIREEVANDGLVGGFAACE
jgi:hypothetical protein